LFTLAKRIVIDELRSADGDRPASRAEAGRPGAAHRRSATGAGRAVDLSSQHRHVVFECHDHGVSVAEAAATACHPAPSNPAPTARFTRCDTRSTRWEAWRDDARPVDSLRGVFTRRTVEFEVLRGARLGSCRRRGTGRGASPRVPEELAVVDKSPRQSSSKKSSRTLKQKRADKKAAAARKDDRVVIPQRRLAK
jgi:hypothetical protein